MWDEFYKAAKRIDSKMEVDEVELRREFREYCRVLGSLPGSPNSMEIFDLMFDAKNNKYQGSEHILAIVGRAMISMSVESMAERSLCWRHTAPRPEAWSRSPWRSR